MLPSPEAMTESVCVMLKMRFDLADDRYEATKWTIEF